MEASKSTQKSWVKTTLTHHTLAKEQSYLTRKLHFSTNTSIVESLVKEIAKPSEAAATELVRSGDWVSYSAKERVIIHGEGKFLGLVKESPYPMDFVLRASISSHPLPLG